MRQAFSLPCPMQHWVQALNLSYDSIPFGFFFLMRLAGLLGHKLGSAFLCSWIRSWTCDLPDSASQVAATADLCPWSPVELCISNYTWIVFLLVSSVHPAIAKPIGKCKSEQSASAAYADPFKVTWLSSKTWTRNLSTLCKMEIIILCINFSDL